MWNLMILPRNSNLLVFSKTLSTVRLSKDLSYPRRGSLTLELPQLDPPPLVLLQQLLPQQLLQHPATPGTTDTLLQLPQLHLLQAKEQEKQRKEKKRKAKGKAELTFLFCLSNKMNNKSKASTIVKIFKYLNKTYFSREEEKMQTRRGREEG